MSESERPAPVLRVGLTGGIGCGKSVVSRELGRLGCYVVDADQLAREVVEPEKVGWERIVEHFGESILLPDRTIDRRALAARIFIDPAQREVLNSLLHPLILSAEEDRVYWLIKTGFRGVLVFEAALMIEAGSYVKYDRLIVVHCAPHVQLKRLMTRDHFSEEEARRRIDAQMDMEEKKAYATHLIDTSGSLRSTHEQVRKVYYSLLDEYLRRESGPSEPLP